MVFDKWRYSVLQDEKSYGDGADSCSTMWIYLTYWTTYLIMVKVVNFMLCDLQHSKKEKVGYNCFGKWLRM